MKAEKTDDNRSIKIQQGEFLSLEADSQSARLTRLGWDTEGTGRAKISLLKSPVELRLSKKGKVLTPQVRVGTPDIRTIRYDFALAGGKQVRWEIAVRSDGLRLQVACG